VDTAFTVPFHFYTWDACLHHHVSALTYYAAYVLIP